MRPRIGAAVVVLAVAALPSAARAQAPADTTHPTITIATPADHAVYSVGQAVVASYSCADDSAVADCSGHLADGAAIDTSTAGATRSRSPRTTARGTSPRSVAPTRSCR